MEELKKGIRKSARFSIKMDGPNVVGVKIS